MIVEISKQYPMKFFNIIQNPFNLLPPAMWASALSGSYSFMYLRRT